jgi:glycosyltransferase involved in cell wall biosynthesis
MNISIVIPVRNGERFLEGTLESVVAQSRQPDEIIVLDDASTDKSAQLCKSSKWNGKIKYFYNESPTGFAEAWNSAVEKASCDYVSILHQDDLLDKEFLSVMEKRASYYSDVRHFFATADYISESDLVIKRAPEPYLDKPFRWSGKEYASHYLHGVLENKHIHRCPGVITHRKLILEKCRFRKEAGHIADDDFFYRIGRYTDVVGISRPLANFRHHSSSETSRLPSLTLALAEGYLFQARCYAQPDDFFCREDREVFLTLAVRFLDQLLYESLVYRRSFWGNRALELRKEMDKVIPGFIDANGRFLIRPMWLLAQSGTMATSMLGLYARSLHTISQWRRKASRLKKMAYNRYGADRRNMREGKFLL